MSFFTKLKKEVGVDETSEYEEPETEKNEEDEQEITKKRPSPRKTRVKKETEKEIVRESQVLSSPSQDSPANEKKGHPWPGKTGELAIDLFQSPDFLVIQSAIAGTEPDSLDITIDNDMLIISGERKKPSQNNETEEPLKYLHQECYWGSFSRKIVLPEEIDITKIEATMKQGILTIKLPRIHKQKIKKIAVRTETD